MQGGALPSYKWITKSPLTIDISPINHSYWTYVHQLSVHELGHHLVGNVMEKRCRVNFDQRLEKYDAKVGKKGEQTSPLWYCTSTNLVPIILSFSAHVMVHNVAIHISIPCPQVLRVGNGRSWGPSAKRSRMSFWNILDPSTWIHLDRFFRTLDFLCMSLYLWISYICM